MLSYIWLFPEIPKFVGKLASTYQHLPMKLKSTLKIKPIPFCPSFIF